MKASKALFLPLLALLLPLKAVGSTALLGLSQNNTVSYVQTSDTSAVADYYTAEMLAAYKGAQITQVCVDMNGSTDHLRVFVASSLTGQPLAEQTVASTGDGWKTVTFDSPYTITGEPVYIGYEMAGVRSLRYGKALISGTEWYRRRNGAWEEYTNDYRSSFYATCEGASVPTANGAIARATLPRYVETQQEMDFTLTLSNLGGEAIKKATFETVVDGEAVATHTVENLGLAGRRQTTVSFSAGTIADEGMHQVALRLVEVNGKTDTDLYMNSTESVRTTVAKEFQPRTVMMEVFSTEKCTSCPAAHALIEKTFDTDKDLIEVCHHAGFLTDDLTIDESKTYEWFYGTNLYAPAVMFDRTAYTADLPDAFYQGVPPVDPKSQSLLGSLLKLSQATPALATVELQTTYDEASRKLTVGVGGDQLLPLDEGMDDIRLNVYLTEDSIFSTTQTASSKSFWHRHTIRQVLTDVWGDPYSLGETGTASFETTLDEAWDASHVAVVAFFANFDAGDKTNCRVLNAAQQKLSSGLSGIKDKASDGAPATPLQRYSASGVRLQQPCQGLNLVRMTDGSVRKVVVRN